MDNVLYMFSPFWLSFYLAGYWMMRDESKHTKTVSAGVGILALSVIFGIDSYARNQIYTWDWWQQVLVISSVLASYFAGIASWRPTEAKA
jgi:hypothetical protein